MPIEARCENCGKLLMAPDSAAGRRAKCPECGDVVRIPESAQPADPFDDGYELDAYDEHFQSRPAAAPQPQAPERPCPVCGELIKASAIRCRFCGEDLMGGGDRPAYRPVSHSGLAISALVLGILSLISICLWFVSVPMAFIAVVLAILDMGASSARTEPASGLAVAGLVCGLIAGVLWGLIFALIVLDGHI